MSGRTAAVGGPIGLLEDGDRISIDAVKGRLDVALTKKELGARKKKVEAAQDEPQLRRDLALRPDRRGPR